MQSSTFSYGRRGVAGLAVAAMLILAGAGDAAAQAERRWTGTITGPNGESTFERTVRGGDGSRSGETTVIGPEGRERSRSFERRWDREAGSGFSSWSRTGPGGRTASGERRIERIGDGEFAVEGIRTGRGGRTRGWEGTIRRVD
ncbi:MAG: hypothetical protein GVY13_01800 [Alphaproteobacteria bacterium]|jgi:hypothetical protein|nr:hypothetical protein [Alphaproteobacteria bacterium]